MRWIVHLIRVVASFGASWVATGWLIEDYAPGVPGLHLVATITLALAMLAVFALEEADA